MAAYWLTFKPLEESLKGWPLENVRDLVKTFQTRPSEATEWWRISAGGKAKVGDRVYVFKQGRDPRGIFAVGTIIGGPYRKSDPADENKDRPPFRCLVSFDALVDPTVEYLLKLDDISDLVSSTLIGAESSGTTVPPEIVPELERRLAPMLVGPSLQELESESADDSAFDPTSAHDERLRAIRAIRVRRGQPAFRAALLDAYGARCAVTRCPIIDILEAAHIFPHLGDSTNVVSNGLLLRTDLHTLFDCGLLAVDPVTLQVVLSEALMNSTYRALAGKPIRKPAKPHQWPSAKALRWRFAAFRSKHAIAG